MFCGSPQTRIPSGQAACSAALEDCYDLVFKLLSTASDDTSGEEPAAAALGAGPAELLGGTGGGGGGGGSKAEAAAEGESLLQSEFKRRTNYPSGVVGE